MRKPTKLHLASESGLTSHVWDNCLSLDEENVSWEEYGTKQIRTQFIKCYKQFVFSYNLTDDSPDLFLSIDIKVTVFDRHVRSVFIIVLGNRTLSQMCLLLTKVRFPK